MIAALPKHLRAYAPICAAAGVRYGVDGMLILAVLDRESGGGLYLKPPGPTGTGDWAPRPWARYEGRPEAATRFVKFEEPTKNGSRIVCLPIDGFGWGRGLMQLDWAARIHYDFLAKLLPDGTLAWRDAGENIYAGAAELAQLIDLFDHDERLAACGYNAGYENVRDALIGLTAPNSDERRYRAADRVTTGKNYGLDVWTRRAEFRRLISLPQPQGKPNA